MELFSSHIYKKINARRVLQAIPPGWKYFGNFEYHDTARIILVWDPRVRVVIYQVSAQLVTCGFFLHAENKNITISFAYGFNLPEQRVQLWDKLVQLSSTTPLACFPWAVMGDFNQILRSSHHSDYPSSSIDTHGMSDFGFALQDSNLFEAPTKGLPFTWWNHHVIDPVSKRIDHALINEHWASSFPHSYAEFLEPDKSDHAPCVFIMILRSRQGSRSRSFTTLWIIHLIRRR